MDDPNIVELDKQWAAEMEQYTDPNTDAEIAHSAADGLLKKLLLSLGFAYTVEAYDRVPKWYA